LPGRFSYFEISGLFQAIDDSYQEFEGRRPGRRITSSFEIGGAVLVPGN
jgi:hypothetical protein